MCRQGVPRAVLPYFFDWVFLLLVILLPLLFISLLQYIPFRERIFSLLDTSIQQPYYPADTFSIILVALVSILVPLACFWVYPQLIGRYYWTRPVRVSFHFTYWWGSTLIRTVGLTVLLTESIKRMAQLLRPDFLGRCFPHGVPAEIMKSAPINNYLVSTDQCQYESQAAFDDGRQAFPSGHTSIACSCSFLLILYFQYLYRRLRLQLESVVRLPQEDAARDPSAARPLMSGEPNGSAHVDGARQPDALVPRAAFLANFWSFTQFIHIFHLLVPFMWGLFVSVSRIFDHKHSVLDVVSAQVVGISVAYCMFRMHESTFTFHQERWSSHAQQQAQAHTGLPLLSSISAVPAEQHLAPAPDVELQAALAQTLAPDSQPPPLIAADDKV